MAHVLAITNRKGGSGKTSTAVNLAAELASRGRRVLLIDLDTQGHCALGLGVKVARGAPTVHGFLAARNSLAEAIVPTVCPGLDLAPADTSFQHGWGQQGEQGDGRCSKVLLSA